MVLAEKDNDKKSKYQMLEEELVLKRKSAWENLGKEERDEIFSFCDRYMEFLDKTKTEREAVLEIERMAKDNGFKKMADTDGCSQGDRLYDAYRKKNAALAVIGKRPIKEGLRIIVSHIDSPRLDLKPNPLYEDSGLAIFKTHYYGGIKKYHWVNRPLALHGVVVRKDGTSQEINIGEKDDEPVFVISDLLPHLASKLQAKRKIGEGIKGEELNILVGNIPVDDEKVKDKVKLAILEHMKDKYGMIEEDFTSAELEAVPSGRARHIGLDRSLIGAYGQDDSVCAYTSLMAACDSEVPEYTSLVLFFDKEEIGSVGNTGARSDYLRYVVGALMRQAGERCDEQDVRDALRNTKALSADVTAAVNPTFKAVHDINNASMIGAGVNFEKYGGGGGKYAASDANTEYVGWVRKILNDSGIPWSTGELGKVDEGGGGTIAMFFANQCMDIIDMGVAVLGMHSPFEVTSKADVYYVYRAYCEFLKKRD